MSHGRHARPGLTQKAVNNTGPIMISGAVAAGLATTGAFTAIPAQASATAPATQHEAHLTDVVTPLKPTFTPNPMYKVKLGDTLSGISDSHCGTWNDWPGIYDANKPVIGGNPNLIEVGQKLKVVCDQAAVPASYVKPAAAPVVDQVATGSNSSMISQLNRQGYDGYAMAYTAMFLFKNGYSRAGAAGVVACIAGESGGNPESVGDGGGGLIGWTPLPGGYVTGNVNADLNTQLEALLHYNDVNGPTAALKSMTNPVYAADFYSQHFERPAVTDSDVRDSVAYIVYANL